MEPRGGCGHFLVSLIPRRVEEIRRYPGGSARGWQTGRQSSQGAGRKANAGRAGAGTARPGRVERVTKQVWCPRNSARNSANLVKFHWHQDAAMPAFA